MQTEIEAKFLNVDHDEVRLKLKQLGAECVQPMRLMRRVVIDYPDKRMQIEGSSWIRIRDEGDKVTMTFKKTTEHEFGGTTEIEVEVSDYQKTIDIFAAAGMVICTDQETKRETWHLNGAEIMLDEWPWLNPFIEVEAGAENIVQEVSVLLGFSWDNALFGSVIVAYMDQYPAIKSGADISALSQIKFDLPAPDWFKVVAS